jgi:glycosyltransferase involved in cell wall biosynthesis
MNIAVDGYEVHDHSTGVGRVIDNLLLNLSEILPDHVFHLFIRADVPRYAKRNIKRWILPSKYGYFRWQNGPLYRNLKRLNPDILIAPNYTLPFFSRWPTFLIEHDISFIAHPEWFTRIDAFKRGFLVRRSLRKARRIFVVSGFSKKEILRRFNLDETKIKVLTHGIGEHLRRSAPQAIDRWKREKGLEGKRIVGYLGSAFNRRNLPLLVEAVGHLRKEQPDVVLHVVGKDLTHPPQNLARIFDKDWIEWEDYIDESNLPFYYSSLDVFAFLSEYEGFGLPPLEALACGTVPVLLEGSSLTEIYTGMAVMVREKRPERVKEALEAVLSQDSIKNRCLEVFSRRKQNFSWQKAARIVAEDIESVLGRRTKK